MKAGNGKIKYVIRGAAALLVFLALLTASYVYGWFIKENENETFIDFSSMEVKSKVYFDGLSDSDPLNRHDGNGFYRAEVTQSNSGAGNFYANLRIDIFFRGVGANYVRVLITEEWIEYDAQAQEEVGSRTTFTRILYNSTMWVDNRRTGPQDITNDGYFYYNDENSQADDPYEISYTPSAPGDYREISLITGLDPAQAAQDYPAGTYLKVKVLSEAVQANRYKEIWNRDNLPVRH